MAKPNGPKIGLYLTERRDGGFYHATASVVTIGFNTWEMKQVDTNGYINPQVTPETIRNASDEPLNGLYLHDLRVRSQGSDDRTPRELYGFDVAYCDVYKVDRSAAEQMAKTLTTIERRMAKTQAKYGNAVTFGQYLARVAEAIGATAIVVPLTSHGWSYSDNDQRIMPIADGVYHADNMISKWIREKETAA
jgi:hypothetical protein